MSDPTSPPWDPEFGVVALVSLILGGIIALGGLAEGDPRGVLAFFAAAFILGLVALRDVVVSSFRGESDE